MYWFMNSYPVHTLSPGPVGRSEGVAASKAPHPHAQAQTRLGASPPRKTAATNKRLHVFPASCGEMAARAKRTSSEIPRMEHLPADTLRCAACLKEKPSRRDIWRRGVGRDLNIDQSHCLLHGGRAQMAQNELRQDRRRTCKQRVRHAVEHL